MSWSKRHLLEYWSQTKYIVIVYSVCQHCTTWRSDHCVPSVNTVPYGGQIIVYSASQHCTTWRSDYCVFRQSTLPYGRSDHCVFRQSTLYHIAVRSLCILSVNTVPYGGQIIAYSICQHCTIWRSDHCVLFQSIQYHIVIVYSVSEHCTISRSDHCIFCQ